MVFECLLRNFVAEHYFASHWYQNIQNEFYDAFTDVQVPNMNNVRRPIDRLIDIRGAGYFQLFLI